jgi:hypothetical protein
MNNCEFEKYFDEYIRGELDADMDISFQNHIQICKTCPVKLDEFYRVHHILKSRKRPKPSPELKKSYNKKLKTSLLINAPVHKISSIIENLVYTQSPWVRIAEVMVILIVGIIIGTVFLSEDNRTKSLPIMQPELFAQPVSKVDIEFMNYYFSASEMILLELMNSDKEMEEIFLTKEVSQKLLMKTFLVHEIALKVREPDILRFLSLMEMILYDMSNISPNEIDETMESVRSLIEEKKLLETIQGLQKRLQNFGSPRILPG